VGPMGGDVGCPGAPTTFLEDVVGGPPVPHEESSLHPRFEKCVVTCMGSTDKNNSAHRSHSPCA
jgi:hypothetical protein